MNSFMCIHYVLIDSENVPLESIALPKLDLKQYRFLIFLGPSQNKLDADFVVFVQRLGPFAEYIKLHSGGRNQKNALDFHIAFYLGLMVTLEERKASFRIISKDKGFDPLVQHLRANGVDIVRSEQIEDNPFTKLAKKLTDTENEQEESVSPEETIVAAAKKIAPAKKSTLETKNTSEKVTASEKQITPKKAKLAKQAEVQRDIASENVETVVSYFQKVVKGRPAKVKTLSNTIRKTIFAKEPFTQAKVDAVLAAMKARGIIQVKGTAVTYHIPATLPSSVKKTVPASKVVKKKVVPNEVVKKEVVSKEGSKKKAPPPAASTDDNESGFLPWDEPLF